MIIVGAGLSGLIAASMLRDQVDSIWEKQKTIPNNHSALLRFRSSVVGDAVGIPFKKVKVIKAVEKYGNDVADAISYSLKCTGKAELRSIIKSSSEIEERYVAPDDFIQRLAKQVESKVIYNESLNIGGAYPVPGASIISTIPMPILMDILGWENKPEFDYMPGTVITCDLPENIDIYATVYFPSPRMIPYRASITGRHLMIEISGKFLDEGPASRFSIMDTLNAFGFGADIKEFVLDNYFVKEMTYAKITPIDESIRKRFILWASEHHNIYSLGRFATWRPGLLLDDIVNDVRVIQRLAGGDKAAVYKARKI